MADTGKMTVTFVPVKVGISDGGKVEVLEPELSGQVVHLGQHLLEDGARIKLAEGAE